MSQISLSIGERLEDFQVLELLGKGGFACVYRAKCLKSGFEVALKMIDRNMIQKKKMEKRVFEEVSIHSKLKHPSIIELYKFFEDSEYVYLVLELAHMGELHRYLRESQRVMTEEETASILTQVVNGLLYLKSNNIVHRDMSLSNLLLTKDFKVKISDFGLATELKRPDEKHMTLCGTPNYISPEVASRASHGLPVDVWGLGCMMYTLLVGKPPFDTELVQSTLTRVVMSEVQMPSNLSLDAQNLLNCMLQKNPTKRIHIDAVLSHPFMKKYTKSYESKFNLKTVASTDSGLMTMSSNAVSAQNIIDKNMLTADPSYGYNMNGYGARERSSMGSFQMTTNAEAVANRFEKLGLAPNTNGFGLQMQQENVHFNHQMQPAFEKPQTDRITPSTERINVPPLNSSRLQPARHRTKAVILSILPFGEVVVEIIKYKSKYNEHRVVDVCKISKDGLRVVVYQPDAGRGSKIGEGPPEVPETGADSFHSYENLPSKHWKKYIYASRFVQMVRSKTPKVTYYSSHAKSQLMESMEDFEISFYDGVKIIQRKDGLKMYDVNGQEVKSFSQLGEFVQKHYQECYDYCRTLERLLSQMQTNSENFPIIVGRRPSSAPILSSIRDYSPNTITPKGPNMYSFAVSASSVLSSRPYSVQSSPVTENQIHVPGVGTVSQLADGAVEVNYHDLSRLSVIPPSQGGGVKFIHTNGECQTYTAEDILPEKIRNQLMQIQTVVKNMMSQKTSHFHQPPRNGTSPTVPNGFITPVSRKPYPQSTMKYFR